MKKSNLVLIGILCVAVMLFCVLTGCVRNDDQQPTEDVNNGPFFDDPTGDSNDDPTGGSNDDPTGGSTQPPAGGNTNGDSSIMDGDHPSIDFG